MALSIIVCIKQVPDPEHFSKISLDPATGNILREGVPTVINPLDRHALEEALRLKEKFSGAVVVLTMGPLQAKEALETALAMGADEAVLLCDPGFAGADTLATAFTLSLAMKKVGFDLVLCGDETIDSGTGQVGPQLAEFLNVPHVAHATALQFPSEHELVARCALERGHLKVAVALPAVVAVAKGINEPRLPTVLGIMTAMQKGVALWDCGTLGADPGVCGAAASPTRVVGVFESRADRKREILTGAPEEAVKKAVARLRELGVM
ncbi:MAG: electron transfer flavoprotein subunit beta/FixA family protein, partial [Chloroflexi bacterium]|nr:electron transfer flavoprotein subunit beta/FixA family protein [Chloroflexota bacterium]